MLISGKQAAHYYSLLQFIIMYTQLIILFVFLLTSSTSANFPEASLNDTLTHRFTEKPYAIDFSLAQQSVTGYTLHVSVSLKDGAHYISPNSRGTYKGKFQLFIAGKQHLAVDRFLIEQPASKEIYDSHPFVNGYVNWVAVDTQYSQQLNVLSTADFNVFGYVQFTIEPRCTLEKIPFIIKQRNGKLVVELDVC